MARKLSLNGALNKIRIVPTLESQNELSNDEKKVKREPNEHKPNK